MTALEVLGMPLLLTDYRGLGEQCCQWARGEGCVALDFANTQIVTMRRHESWFRELTSSYDGFPPDGMPLVWCLRLAGAHLRDRVYGPTFMREFLRSVPKEFTHYLLGGSEECGAKLRAVFGKVNPGIQFVGAFHGKCAADGRMEDAAEEAVIAEINRLSPDFIWVGFAFDVNAGMKPDAPAWMQRMGLTWVYRLGSEPGRLWWRYLRYNSLFLFYLLWDGLRGKAWKRG